MRGNLGPGEWTISTNDESTLDPDATAQTVDTLGHAIDGALAWDHIEEHRALARVEQGLFARPPKPLQISRYLLLRPLGSGGAGIVYDGYDPELSRRVAVKVLRAGRRDPEAVERARARFVREAKSIAQLSHPNVIAVYDVGTYGADELSGVAAGPHGEAEGEGVFIVMEQVEGADLASWIERGTRGWREVVEVFLAAGEGLAAAHRSGIVHRDFKPGNVLVGQDGRVKVVDFGLALAYDGEPDSALGDTPTPSMPGDDDSLDGSTLDLLRLTQTGVVLGTPAYMAPEQHRGDPADQKADQFAYCASLYRALFGRHAFSGRTMDSLFASKVRGKLRSPPDGVSIPAWVLRVIRRGCDPDPAKRFGNMEALLRALRADPALRLRRVARWVAVPLAVAALGYAGWVATRPGQVSVNVTSGGAALPGARVFVGEQELRGGQGEVAAGVYRLRVTAPQHEPREQVLEVNRSGTHEVAVELDHEQGHFTLHVEPASGRIFVDGVDYGSRLQSLAVDTGPHEILVRHRGYEDQRLSWVAEHGRTRSDFVALRKALVWARDASGVYRQSDWLGDVDGDGLDDLLHRRFTVLTAYDPWDDAELWRVELGATPFYRLCDLDGDGVSDVVTMRADDEARTLRVYDGATKVRRPQPRISVSRPTTDAPTWLEVACVAADGGGAHDLIAIGLDAGVVERLAGDTGERRWWTGLEVTPLHVVPLRGAGARVESVGLIHRGGVVSVGADDGRVRWQSAVPLGFAGPLGEPTDRWKDSAARVYEARGEWAVGVPLDERPGDDLLTYAGDDSGYRLVALAGHDGAVRWTAPVSAVESLRLGESLGDVDHDGTIDVLTYESGGVGVRLGASGRRAWFRERAGNGPASLLAEFAVPLVALQDKDTIELVDAASGRSLATRQIGPRSSRLVAADWDGDMQPEVVFGTRDGVLHAVDRHLNPVATMPMEKPIERFEARRDANHDGFADLLLQAQGPAVIAGPKICWDRRPTEAIRATPVIHDFDLDGELELAVFGRFGDGDEGLRVLDARTGLVEAGMGSPAAMGVIRPPAVLPTAQGPVLFAPGGTIRRFDGHTAEFETSRAVGSGYASPTLADLDGDGESELVVVTWEDPGEVHVLDPKTLEPRWVRGIGDLGSFGAAHVSDVDRDGEPEVVVATLGGRVVSLSAQGDPQWETETGGRLNFEPAPLDRHGDGRVELAVTPHTDDDPIVLLDGATGDEVARWPHMGSRRARPIAHDLDGDGRAELLASTAQRGLVAVASDGPLLWSYRFADGYGLQPGAAGSPLLADLEGDGRPELLAGFEDGSVIVVDASTGALVWRFAVGREEVEASPVAADVDGDGVAEVFVSGLERRLLCLRHRPAIRPADP